MAFDISRQPIFSSNIGLRHVRISDFKDQYSWLNGVDSAHMLHNWNTYATDSCAKKPTASQSDDEDVRDIAFVIECKFFGL